MMWEGKPGARWALAVAVLLTVTSRPVIAIELSASSWAGLHVDPLQASPDALINAARPAGGSAALECEPERGEAKELDLGDAVRMALCANPRAQLAWIAIKPQAASLGQARSAYLPRVNASVRRVRDTTWADSGGSSASTERRATTTTMSLVWRLLDFGTRSANLEAANDLLAAALMTHDAVVQQTMAAVVQAYFDVQTSQAVLLGGQAGLAAARSTLETARRKQTAGPGSASETLQAKTAMARAMLEVGRAEGNLAQAKVALATIIGIRAESELNLPPLVPPDAPQLGQTLATWLNDTRTKHPAIGSAQLQRAAARSQVDAARADGLPSLDLSAAYYRNGRPDQGLSGVPTRERQIGVVLNIPLFEGFERTYRIRSAEALAEQRDAELREVEQRVAMEVAQAFAGTEAALKGLEASELLLETATASEASSSRRYQHGVADVLEVLSTQQSLADAQQQRGRSVAAWYTASLRLAAAAGRLSLSELQRVP